MIKLDDNLLQELGLGALSPEEKKKMLAHIYETLEMRVGMELAKQMTDAQLNEFEEFINRNDEAGALRWLESNFPNYKDVVAAEFDKLKHEISQVAPHIVASSQQQSLAPQGPAAAMPPAGNDYYQAQAQAQQQQYAAPAAAPWGYPQGGGGSVPQQPQQQYPPMPPAQQPYYPPNQTQAPPSGESKQNGYELAG